MRTQYQRLFNIGSFRRTADKATKTIIYLYLSFHMLHEAWEQCFLPDNYGKVLADIRYDALPHQIFGKPNGHHSLPHQTQLLITASSTSS